MRTPPRAVTNTSTVSLPRSKKSRRGWLVPLPNFDILEDANVLAEAFPAAAFEQLEQFTRPTFEGACDGEPTGQTAAAAQAEYGAANETLPPVRFFTANDIYSRRFGTQREGLKQRQRIESSILQCIRCAQSLRCNAWCELLQLLGREPFGGKPTLSMPGYFATDVCHILFGKCHLEDTVFLESDIDSGLFQ